MEYNAAFAWRGSIVSATSSITKKMQYHTDFIKAIEVKDNDSTYAQLRQKISENNCVIKVNCPPKAMSSDPDTFTELLKQWFFHVKAGQEVEKGEKSGQTVLAFQNMRELKEAKELKCNTYGEILDVAESNKYISANSLDTILPTVKRKHHHARLVEAITSISIARANSIGSVLIVCVAQQIHDVAENQSSG